MDKYMFSFEPITKLVKALFAPSVITVFGVALIGFHFDRVSDLRSDYEAKLDVVEREKNDAINERDRYFNYLVSIPGSFTNLENEINKTQQKNDEISLELENFKKLSSTTEKKELYKNNAFIRRDSTYNDQETGLSVALLDADRSQDGITNALISITLPNEESGRKTVAAGERYSFDDIDGRGYFLVINEINWYGDTIDVTVSEAQTYKFVKKNHLLP